MIFWLFSGDVQFPVHLNDPPSLPLLAFDGDSPQDGSSQDVTGWTMIWTRKPFHDSQLYHDFENAMF